MFSLITGAILHDRSYKNSPRQLLFCSSLRRLAGLGGTVPGMETMNVGASSTSRESSAEGKQDSLESEPTVGTAEVEVELVTGKVGERRHAAALSASAGAGAAALIGAGLGVISLTGTWAGRVAAERQNLIGQIESSRGGSPAQHISRIYGDAWHLTAVVDGTFAVLALLLGIVVLARQAFGASNKPQPVWMRSFAWAAVTLGALGLTISGVLYTDIVASLPTTGTR